MPEIQVGIIMGSDSDLPIMQKCADALDEFGIGWEMVVSSAHHHSEKTARYARGAAAAKVEEKDCALLDKLGQCKRPEPGDQ